MGKCITADSYIWASGLKTFGSAFGSLGSIQGPKAVDSITGWYDDGIRPGYEVTLQNGSKIDGTPDHRLWCRTAAGYEGWVPTKDITLYHFVAVARGKADFGPLTMELDEAYTLGLLVADGSITNTPCQRLQIDKQVPQLLRVVSTIRNWVSLAGGRQSNKVKVKVVNDNHAVLTAHAPHFKELLRDRYNLKWGESYERLVPNHVMLGSRSVIRQFLVGYFDGDGFCDQAVAASTCNPGLAKQLCALLTGMGVANCLKVRATVGMDAYIVTVNDVDAFCHNVGFTAYGVGKDKRFATLCEGLRNTNVDTVPGIGKLLRSAAKYVPSKHTRTDAWRHVDAYYAGFKKPSYNTLRHLLASLPKCPQKQVIKGVVDDHYYWVKVQDIKASYSHRIDCEVAEQHAFVANGIINHNTVVFANMPDFLGFSKRMMVTVHREELVHQAADKLRKWNPTRSVGIEMADYASNHEDLIVASVQTIGKLGSARLKKFDPHDFDCIEIDECHHSISKTYQNIINHFNVFEDKHRLLSGVTATPNRADGQGLGDTFQKIVFDMNLRECIDQGWLADMRCIKITSESSLDAVSTLADDLNQGQLADAVNTPARNDLIVRSWLDHGEDRQTVAFCVDIQHSKDLAAAFKRYGVSAEAIWGSDPDRAFKLKCHRNGSIKVLTNCNILTEGYDDWRIACIIAARPTKSEGLYTQIVGRGTRIPEGISNLVEARAAGVLLEKQDCIYLDVVDLSSKHSLVTMPSLFGLGKGVDLKKKKITQVMLEVDEVKAQQPALDLTQVQDITKLKSYAEKVDMFKVTFDPLVVQFSEFAWNKVGIDAYRLSLHNSDFVKMTKDLLDNWKVCGQCLTQVIDFVEGDFKAAIFRADDLVRKYGGKSLLTIIKREAKWHGDAITPAQIAVLKRWKIGIPAGMTKGDAKNRITKLFAELAEKRAGRKAA